jgi:hypothetical protein
MATKKPVNQKEKAKNEGNLAEGVLGAAIVAKLCLRQPNGVIGRVVANDVMKVLKVMQRMPLTPKGVSKAQIKVDMGGSAKDKILFALNLGKAMMEELQTIDLKLLQRAAEGAASYVNSAHIEALAEAMYQNNINNKLEIDVDGISQNSTTKSDIMVKTDKYVFEKISLKAGAKKSGKTLGQIGGNSWTCMLRLFHEGYNERAKTKDIGLNLPLNTKANEDQYMKLISQSPTYTTVARAVMWTFETAERMFNSQAAGLRAHNVFKFLQSHSTKGDADIKIVMLHLGKHKTLNPLRLEQALKEVKLKAVVRSDTQWPVFLVYDASMNVPNTVYSESTIFAIRPKKVQSTTDGYIASLVEEGPRFASLIEED